MNRKQRKTLALILTLIFIFQPFLQLMPIQKAQAASTVTVTITSNHQPGYIWCQKLDGTWTTDSTIDGPQSANDAGGEPAYKKVRTYAYLSAPTNGDWTGSDGKDYQSSRVQNEHPVFAIMDPNADTDIKATNPLEIANGKVIIDGYSGQGVSHLAPESDNPLCGGRPGINYPFPVIVTWQGTVTLNSGTAHIRHYTTDGESLNGTFSDKDVPMEEWQNYSFSHPTNAGYTYKGWKKSTNTPPSSEAITNYPADPYPLEPYDGSFTDYYVYFYYDRAASYSSIDVRPATKTINTGQTAEFVAYGIRSDNSGEDVIPDSELIWSTSNSAIATIDSSGNATGVSTGATTVQAVWTTKNLQDTANLTIQAGTIEYNAIDVRPPTKTINVGQAQEFIAYGIRSDGSGEDPIPDSQLTWSTTSSVIATIDSSGYATGVSVGTTTVKAVWTAKSLSDTASLTVRTGESYDFTISPGPSINFRDTFTLTPQINPAAGCTYQSHHFRVVKNGQTWTSEIKTYKNVSVSVTYPYPSPVGTGSNEVYMDVVTSCGTKTVGPKPVMIGPSSSNQPPNVQINWYKSGEATPTTSVKQGEKVDIRITSYSDPDGDPVMVRAWDFNRSTLWVQSLPSKYNLNTSTGVYFPNMTTEQSGEHTVYLTVHDGQGGEYTASAILTVLDPKPIAVIEGPTIVKEDRPIPYDFSGAKSYSPIGRSIVTYEWGNKLGTYPNPGQETVTLRVKDSDGRWSDVATHQLTVIADQPPIAGLSFPNTGTRMNSIVINSTSYSPDGDTINYHAFEYKYDRNNNGSFADDSWVLISQGTATSTTFQPTRVGKYLFRGTAREVNGQQDNTDNEPVGNYTFTVDNLAPTTAVITEGNTYTPPDPRVYSMSGIYTYWTHRNTNGGATTKSSWEVVDGTLRSKVFNTLTDFRSTHLQNYQDATGFPNQAKHFYASLQTTPIITNLGNTKWSERYFARDDKYLYNYGWNKTIKAYDFNLNQLWSCTLTQYSQLDSGITSYNGRLYVLMRVAPGTSKDLVIINRNTGSLEKSVPLNMSGYSNGYIYTGPAGVAVLLNGKMMKFTFDGTKITEVAFPYSILSYVQSEGFAYAYDSSNKSIKRINMADFTEVWSVTVPEALVRTGVDKDHNLLVNYGHTFHYWYGYTGLTIAKYSKNGALLSTNKLQVPGGADDNLDYFMFNNQLGWDSNGLYYNAKWANNSTSYTGLGTIYVYGTNGTLINSLSLGYVGGINRFEEGADGLINLFGIEWSCSSCSKYPYLITYNPATNQFMYQSRLNTAVQYEHYIPVFLGDQKFLFVSTTADSNNSYLLQGTGALSVPKKFELGESFSDIWYGGVSLSQESTTLVFKPTKVSGEGVGLAFRVQDATNYYSAEFENGQLLLKRVQGGSTVILTSKSYGLTNNMTYRVKIKPEGNRYNVYVNDLLELTATEHTFASGLTGIVNRGQQGVHFNSLSYVIEASPSGTLSGIVLKNNVVTYTVSYTDPENDPRLTQGESWTYTHDPNLFLNSEGVWSGSGGTFASAVTTFDKPGLYSYTFRTKDDPHPEERYPSNAFNGYRKFSNTVSGTLRVHRKPIAQFTVVVNADNSLSYPSEMSYDPDRYNPTTGQYSTEATGINYQSTRGILERNWRYRKSTDNTYTSGKLVTPSSAGTWIIELSVKDEYGAWSDWTQQIVVTGGAAPVNEPPKAGFTLSHTETYRGVPVSITSTASDPEDGGAANIAHEYFMQNISRGDPETLQSTNRGTWPKSFSSMGTINIRQLVTDSKGQAAQMTKSITIINRLPVTNVTSPSSTNQTSPTIVTVKRPTFTFQYNDADSDPQVRYQVRIYKYGGVLYSDSGEIASNAYQWTPNADLPENVDLYVVIRTFDGYDWGAYSSPKYFRVVINKPPTADFTWSPNPVYEGDSITLINASVDPDGDTLMYQWTVSGPMGYLNSFTTQNGTVPGSVTSNRTGNYMVTLTVTDPGNAAHSVTKSITVGDLQITGQISHTPEWEAYRQQWNAKFPDKTRSPDTFWAGEAFVLSAVVTNTATSITKPQTVTAVLTATGDSVPMTSSNRINYSGQMVNTDFPKLLSDGSYTMRFTVIWTNGHSERHDVPFTIAGSINDVIVTQLRN